MVASANSGLSYAFTRTMDEDPPGKCLWWVDREVGYYLNAQCSDDFTPAERATCIESVKASFQAWSNVNCSDFGFLYMGLTDSVAVGFDSVDLESNTNLVLWQESEWVHPPDALGITTNTFDTRDGSVVDSDIELNGVNWHFSADGNPYRIDVQNTITHEAGHVVGLDHSPVFDATMYPTASDGDIAKRDLHIDDINGICFIYPIGEATPSQYLNAEQELIPCGVGDEKPEESSSGCQCRTDRQADPVEIFLLIGLLLGLLVRRAQVC